MTATIESPAVTAPPRPQANPTAEADARTQADARTYARRWYTLGVLCLSLLVIVVDATIVNVALPTLARTLHASTSGLQWIVDGYTLTFAALLLLAGAIADRYGRQRALAGGLALFAAGSLAAALTHTTAELALSGAVFLNSQILQFLLGYSPLAAGVRALPSAAALATFSPLGAALAKRAGVRVPVALSLAAVAAGLALFATATAASGYGHYITAMVIVCAGIGLAMSAATAASMAELPPALAGVGSAVNDTTRNMGSVLGVAVFGSIAASVFGSRMSHKSGSTGRWCSSTASNGTSATSTTPAAGSPRPRSNR